jgi:hypothetical protein
MTKISQTPFLSRLFSVSEAFIDRMVWLTLCVAFCLMATWLWGCWCSFPAIPWNDLRIAPSVALHHGVSIYSVSDSGAVSSWIYGPLPLILFWPSGLASSAVGALMIAGAIHIGLTVIVLSTVCLLWPDIEGRVGRVQIRLAAAMLCILLVRNPTSGYIVFSVDASGIAFGLLSLLSLTRHRYWLAAFLAAASVACKQTMIGVGVAQVIWLFITASPRDGWRQAGRCGVAGAVLLIPTIGYFGAVGLWHTMLEVPARFPWASLSERLADHYAYLLIYVILPVVAMVFWRSFFFSRRSLVLLPSLAFFCVLPMGVAGFLRIGGNVNSLHSFWLWFPPTLVVLALNTGFARWSRYALAISAVALASYWLQISHLPTQPSTLAYSQASYLAERMPEKIWFPLNPLITLYSDKRFYHDLDGLGERTLAGQHLTPQHFYAGMPRQRQVSATLLPVGWGLWGMENARLPEDTPVRSFGQWRLDGKLE